MAGWGVGPGMLLAACAARLPTPGRGSYFGMQVAVSQAHARTVRLPPAVEAPIQWPSAIAGLVLAIAVVVGVSWLASTRQSEHRLTVRAAPIVPTQPEPAAAAGQAAQAPAPTVAPTPIPPPAQATSAPELASRQLASRPSRKAHSSILLAPTSARTAASGKTCASPAGPRAGSRLASSQPQADRRD